MGPPFLSLDNLPLLCSLSCSHSPPKRLYATGAPSTHHSWLPCAAPASTAGPEPAALAYPHTPTACGRGPDHVKSVRFCSVTLWDSANQRRQRRAGQRQSSNHQLEAGTSLVARGLAFLRRGSGIYPGPQNEPEKGTASNRTLIGGGGQRYGQRKGDARVE